MHYLGIYIALRYLTSFIYRVAISTSLGLTLWSEVHHVKSTQLLIAITINLSHLK